MAQAEFPRKDHTKMNSELMRSDLGGNKFLSFSTLSPRISFDLQVAV